MVGKTILTKLMASLAPARAEIDAGVVAKADQKLRFLETSRVPLIRFPCWKNPNTI